MRQCSSALEPFLGRLLPLVARRLVDPKSTIRDASYDVLIGAPRVHRGLGSAAWTLSGNPAWLRSGQYLPVSDSSQEGRICWATPCIITACLCVGMLFNYVHLDCTLVSKSTPLVHVSSRDCTGLAPSADTHAEKRGTHAVRFALTIH